MAVTYGFYDSLTGDRTYNAAQMSSIFDGLISDGVFMSIGDSLMVFQNAGMNVSVGAGRAWFNHTWTLNDATLVLTLDASSAIISRIDAIVLEVNAGVAYRTNTIKIIKGTPASVPVKPTLINTTTQHQYALAYITVGPSVTAITNANIENMVGTVSCPFVTAIIESIDVATLLTQWDAQFDIWFDEMKDQLTTDAAGNLQAQIDVVEGTVAGLSAVYMPIVSPSVVGNTLMSTGSAWISNARSNRNIIINGGMLVNQRGLTSLAAIGRPYLSDRFCVAAANLGDGTLNMVEEPLVPSTNFPFSKAFRLTPTHIETAVAAGEKLSICYRMEGYDYAQLQGNQATLSFYVKAVKTGIYCATFETVCADTSSRSYIHEFTINSASTWERKTVTLTFNQTATTSLTNLTGLFIGWTIFCGSTYSISTALKNTWQTGSYYATDSQVNGLDNVNNVFQLTGVQLELGAVATPFEIIPYSMSLAKCKRYYEPTDIVGPISAIYAEATPLTAVVGPVFQWSYATEKRALPTLSAFGTFTRQNYQGDFVYTTSKTQCSVSLRALAAGRCSFYNTANAGFIATIEL